MHLDMLILQRLEELLAITIVCLLLATDAIPLQQETTSASPSHPIHSTVHKN